MNFNPPAVFKAPALWNGILRLALPSGEEYDVQAALVVDVFAAADCCGGSPITLVRMTTGNEYLADHPPDVLRDLLVAFRRSQAGLFG